MRLLPVTDDAQMPLPSYVSCPVAQLPTSVAYFLRLVLYAVPCRARTQRGKCCDGSRRSELLLRVPSISQRVRGTALGLVRFGFGVEVQGLRLGDLPIHALVNRLNVTFHVVSSQSSSQSDGMSPFRRPV